MADPVLDLAGDPQRLHRAVGSGDVAGELLVGEVGVVVERSGRLDDINPPARVWLFFWAFRELRTPGRRLESRAEIDVLQAPLDEVASEAGRNDVADFQVGLGAVIESGAGRDVLGVHISALPQSLLMPRIRPAVMIRAQ